jgi:hypothetical protein
VAVSSDASTAITRAEADIDAGRLWKARDRLSVAVRASPTDQAILVLLGAVHFRMGYQPAAWRYWALTSHEGLDAEAAERAFGERYGRAGLLAQLREIPAREPIESYPSAARERLEEWRRQARDEGIDWPDARSIREQQLADDDDVDGGWVGAVLLVGLLIGPWLFGFAAALYLLGRLVLGVF